MTTHDRLRSAEVAQRVGVLDKGRLSHITVDELASHAVF
jgi:ABC-type sulfate/molybdate transport systems ATPase subunit